MEMAIKLGKPVNPNLHIGICGEHGGDPSSVEFCHKIGLTTYPAHHSVCLSQDLPQHRQRSIINNLLQAVAVGIELG